MAASDDVPGLVAEGQTLIEVVQMAQSLTAALVESYREHGGPLPPTLVSAAVLETIDLIVPVTIG